MFSEIPGISPTSIKDIKIQVEPNSVDDPSMEEEMLTFEIWTNGEIPPREALSEACRALRSLLSPFFDPVPVEDPEEKRIFWGRNWKIHRWIHFRLFRNILFDLLFFPSGKTGDILIIAMPYWMEHFIIPNKQILEDFPIDWNFFLLDQLELSDGT